MLPIMPDKSGSKNGFSQLSDPLLLADNTRNQILSRSLPKINIGTIKYSIKTSPINVVCFFLNHNLLFCKFKLLQLDCSNANIVKYNWVSQVKNYFFNLGYEWLWYEQDASLIEKFKEKILCDLRQQLITDDLVRINNSTYSSVYSLIADQNFNLYLRLNISFEITRVISQVRMASDNLCVIYTKGNRYEINSLELCPVCNYEKENLAHIFINCPGYIVMRQKYLSKYFPLTAENVLIFKNKSHSINVYKFIIGCLDLRKSLLDVQFCFIFIF